MILAAAILGWSLVLAGLAVAFAQRRRLDLVADADHELRGPVTALALGIEALGGDPATRARGEALMVELDRLRCGLDDLAAARRGIRRSPLRGRVPLHALVSASAAGWSPFAARRGRRLVLDWRAGGVCVAADRGRLAQLFGNLVANAIEHGGGRIALRGERRDGAVRVEVCDEGLCDVTPIPVTGRDARAGRGRGLRIAARAAEDAGGELSFQSDEQGTRAVVELPVADA